MKDRIGIAIVALVSLLISCLVCAGCTPTPGYITIDSQSEVMQPTFCMYDDPYLQERLDIESIIVWKRLHSSEEKKRLELDSRQVYLPLGHHLGDLPEQVYPGMVWYLQYKSSDNFIKRLLGRRLMSPVSSLTYGDVPPGYEEEVKARSLEPEQLYTLQIEGYDGSLSNDLDFIIRLDETGSPDRLEYLLRRFLFTDSFLFRNTRDSLKLD